MFTTIRTDQAPALTAPDGSTMRPLCMLPGVASLAQFELAPNQISQAVSHATVQEIWYIVDGGGQMWRAQDAVEEITELEPGLCVTIPLGTRFQFRGGPSGLRLVAITTPPWPETPGEARPENGPW